jgi:hypothetical protein
MVEPRNFTIDVTRWPIVIITQHVAQLTDEERIASLESTDYVLNQRSGRYAIVLDNRRAAPPSPTQRAMIAEYGLKSIERIRARCICTAIVVTTDVMRAMVTAVQWKTGRPPNTEVFDDLAIALAWTKQRVPSPV